MQGGHGNAGWKRHRWSSVIRYGWEIGKTGFTPLNPHHGKAINISDLDLQLDRLTEKGAIKMAEGKIEIDLGKMGYSKLLGNGKVAHPFKILVAECSEKAREKIGQAGGQVILPEAAETATKG